MKNKQFFLSKSKRKLYISVLFCLLSLFSVFGIFFSYSYGCSKQSTRMYSCLMSLDSKVKKQQNTDFLHGSLEFDKSTSTAKDYKTFIKLQTLTKTQYNFYNSFLVSSSDGVYSEYNVDFGISATVPVFKTHLVEVATYWDYDYMESIGLPLFKQSSIETRITEKNGAQLGSYISARKAEELVKTNGMLNEANNDLSLAFSRLLQDDSFVFTISSDADNNSKKITMSVNGIYIDSDHLFLLNDFQKRVQERKYGNYSRSFDYWFKDSIFTYSFSIFSSGCSYIFDIRKNYGNFDRFFTSVIGYDYSVNNLVVSFFNENGDCYEETAIFNDASRKINDRSKAIFLVLSIICMVCVGLSFELLYSIMLKKERILYAFLPFGIYLLIQVIFYGLINMGLDFYVLYFLFNSTGNIICLVSLFLILINAIVWSLYAKKNNKYN